MALKAKLRVWLCGLTCLIPCRQSAKYSLMIILSIFAFFNHDILDSGRPSTCTFKIQDPKPQYLMFGFKPHIYRVFLFNFSVLAASGLHSGSVPAGNSAWIQGPHTPGTSCQIQDQTGWPMPPKITTSLVFGWLMEISVLAKDTMLLLYKKELVWSQRQHLFQLFSP